MGVASKHLVLEGVSMDIQAGLGTDGYIEKGNTVRKYVFI